MFYIASKIIFFILRPSTVLIGAIAVGLIIARNADRRRRGLWIAGVALVTLIAAGLSPLANIVLLPLEQRFAETRLSAAEDNVAGIIILGGFEDGWVSAGRAGLGVNEAAERLTEGVRLARRWPNAKVVFTGGVAALVAGGLSATGPVGAFLEDVDIASERIVLEGASRNTRENAVLTHKLVKPKPGEIWLLVTSAYHMPRAMGVFRNAGFDVSPAPVDFRTRGPGDRWRTFPSIPDGLKRLDLAAREWLGLFAYYVTGRTDVLFPSPSRTKP